MASTKSVRRKIDWEEMRVVVDDGLDPNPQNPYAAVTSEQRTDALRDLARKMLLRKAAAAADIN